MILPGRRLHLAERLAIVFLSPLAGFEKTKCCKSKSDSCKELNASKQAHKQGNESFPVHPPGENPP